MSLELLAHLDLSAASGLVHRDGFLYVVADDELALVRTDLVGGSSVRLPLGDAPSAGHIPKGRKPDFEALLSCGSSLVAIGSGSTAARRVAIALEGALRRTVELGPLYAALDQHIHELNIEGAVVRGDEVLLAQRGNGSRRENALVRLDRARFEQELATGTLTADCLREVSPVALGNLEGVPLSLTDLCLGPRGELIFTAAAEATDNPYDDGVVKGSVIGVLDGGRRVVVPGVKLEGVCWLKSGELRLVADPDDPAKRAPLFRLAWPA